MGRRGALDKHQKRVAAELGGHDGIFVIDETSDAKKGDWTVGVDRQYCGEALSVSACARSSPMRSSTDPRLSSPWSRSNERWPMGWQGTTSQPMSSTGEKRLDRLATGRYPASDSRAPQRRSHDRGADPTPSQPTGARYRAHAAAQPQRSPFGYTPSLTRAG